MIHHNPLIGEKPGKKFITMGEIMLRLTPPNYEKIRMASSFEASYGGSEANIALALANLGVDSTFFSVVPNNSIGKSAIRMLRSNTQIIEEPALQMHPVSPNITRNILGGFIIGFAVSFALFLIKLETLSTNASTYF